MHDISFPHQQITIRPEITKKGRGRVVRYGNGARDLLQRYLEERADEDISAGLLFRSQSDRTRTQGVTADPWDKVVERIARRTG